MPWIVDLNLARRILINTIIFHVKECSKKLCKRNEYKILCSFDNMGIRKSKEYRKTDCWLKIVCKYAATTRSLTNRKYKYIKTNG